jgi:hypothetical protein
MASLYHAVRLQRPPGANGAAFVADVQDGMTFWGCLSGAASFSPIDIRSKQHSLYCRHESQYNDLAAVFAYVPAIVHEGR